MCQVNIQHKQIRPASFPSSEYNIQDFTTATPLEVLARQISQFLIEWTPDCYAPFTEPRRVLKTDFLSSGSQYRLICVLTYHETTAKSKKPTSSTAGPLPCRGLCFTGGKSLFFYRCFGTPSYAVLQNLSVSQLSSATANSLLEATLLGCSDAGLLIPCFVQLDDCPDANSHFIGRWVCCSGTQAGQLTDFETDKSESVPNVHPAGSEAPIEAQLFEYFCFKTGLLPEAIPCFGSLVTGVRYIYFWDMFTPLTRSFWTRPITLARSTSALIPAAPDPIAQLHFIRTWHPQERTSPCESIAVHDEDDTWSLRIVLQQENDWTDTLSHHPLTLTHLLKIILAHVLRLGQPLEHAAGFPDIPQPTSRLSFLESRLEAVVNRALFSLSPVELQKGLLHLFCLPDASNLTESTISSSPCITPDAEVEGDGATSFCFRLLTFLGQIKTTSSLASIWKDIVAMLRQYWERRMSIPHLAPDVGSPKGFWGLPLPTDPPLLQKLKALNCCIHQQRFLYWIKQFREGRPSNIDTSVETLLEPPYFLVFPPADWLTCQTLIDTTATMSPYLPLESIMEFYCILYPPHLGETPTLEGCIQWIQRHLSRGTLSETEVLNRLTFPSLLNPFVSSHTHKNIDPSASSSHVRQRCWDKVLKRVNPASPPAELLAETLFSTTLYAEMTLHWLEHLTPFELCVDLLHLLLKLTFEIVLHTYTAQDKLRLQNQRSNCLQKLAAAIRSVSLSVPHWTFGRGSLSTWTLYSAVSEWEKPFLQTQRDQPQGLAPPNSQSSPVPQTLQDVAVFLFQALSEVETRILLAFSLEDKLAPLFNAANTAVKYYYAVSAAVCDGLLSSALFIQTPTDYFLAVIHAIHEDEEISIPFLEGKHAVIDILHTMMKHADDNDANPLTLSGSLSDTLLPSIHSPFSREVLFQFIPRLTRTQPIQSSSTSSLFPPPKDALPSSFCMEHSAYFSVLPKEFRAALRTTRTF